MKFSIKDFFNKCDQTRSFLRIWSHLQEKSLIIYYFNKLLQLDFLQKTRIFTLSLGTSW